LKVLVTGGAGFLGSHLVESLLDKGYDVLVFDDLSTGDIKNIQHTDAQIVIESIRNYDAVVSAMKKVDIVFHLAAVTSIIETNLNPYNAFEVNTLGTLNVLRAVVKCGVSKIIFFSSAAVYGDNPNIPINESAVLEPKSVYGLTKLDGEYITKIYSISPRLAEQIEIKDETISIPEIVGWNHDDKSNGVDYIILRAFNAYGPRQRMDSQYSAVIPKFINFVLKNRPITIFGDGTQTRDFIYASDVADASIFLAEKDVSGIFNLGNGNEITIYELATRIAGILGVSDNMQVEYKPPQEGDIYRSAADISKLKQIGFSPSVSLQEGLVKTINYFQ